MIDRALPIPLYHQFKTILLGRIKRGELRPEDRLPSEEELADHYGVSKATIRQALSELAIAGFVRREQGRGTFVSGEIVNVGPRELTSFTHEMRKRDKKPTSLVLVREVLGAQGEVAEKLAVPEGAEVCCLKRLRLADDHPMGIQTAYVPVDLAPRLIDEFVEGSSLYQFLESRHKLIPARAREIHRAVSLDASDAALLQVAEGTPALAAERITYLESGRPFELVHSVMCGDRYEITLDLVNPANR